MTHARLFADDCFYLAQERIDGKNSLNKFGVEFALAIEWAEAALQ